MLVNSILDAATTGEQKTECLRDLDALDVRPVIQALMVPPHDSGLLGSLLDFQSSLIRAVFHQHRSSVDTAGNISHARLLREVWQATGLDAREIGVADSEEGWADVLGLDRQAGGRGRVVWRTGQLGLDCLVSWACSILVDSLALER